MAEQLELFPDFHGLGQSNQKRTQLGFLMQVPESCVDDYLILEAWNLDTGYNLVEMARQQLSAKFGCNSLDLIKNLRDRKFREFVAARVNVSAKKMTELSVRLDLNRLRVLEA